MPKFRCEFIVSGDLVLPKDGSPLPLTKSDSVTIHLHNGDADAQGHVKALRAVVIGPADSIEVGERSLRTYLVRHLDLLTFSTQSRFQVVRAIRLIEWEPHQKERLMLVYGSRQDTKYPPAPELHQEYSETIAAIEDSGPPAFVRTALRQYRYALLSDHPDDQFMRLWLALEIIAENLKAKQRVAIECPTCRADLECPTCGPAMRMPMAKQAIEVLISRITGPEWQKNVSMRQFKARNGLMHGSTTQSIAEKCGVPFEQVVDELGAVVWQAIVLSMPTWNSDACAMGRRASITASFLNPAAHLSFQHRTADEHPDDDALPNAQIAILTKFKDVVGTSEYDRQEKD
ncbi:hypothetical protein [Phyllobacterium sp. P5_D12]